MCRALVDSRLTPMSLINSGHYVCPWRHGRQCFGAPKVSERRHRCAARHPPQASSINIAAGLHKSVQGRGCKRHGQLDPGPGVCVCACVLVWSVSHASSCSLAHTSCGAMSCAAAQRAGAAAGVARIVGRCPGDALQALLPKCEQAPFTVQLIDENDETIVEQKFNASAGEFRLDRVRVVRAKGDPRQLNFERRNWTVYSLRDANGYRSVYIRLLAPPHTMFLLAFFGPCFLRTMTNVSGCDGAPAGKGPHLVTDCASSLCVSVVTLARGD